MNITIKAIHFDASEKLVNFINKKIEKLGKHNERIFDAEVTLKVVKPETAMNKEAAIMLSYPDKSNLFASKTADSFEEAIDLTVEALKRQLEKAKEKEL